MRLPLCCLFFKGSIRHYDLCLSLSQLESHITYVSSQTEFWFTLCTRGSCFISNFKCILSTHDWVMDASRSGLSCRHLWTSVSLVLPTLCLRKVLSLSTQDCLPCPLLNLKKSTPSVCAVVCQCYNEIRLLEICRCVNNLRDLILSILCVSPLSALFTLTTPMPLCVGSQILAMWRWSVRMIQGFVCACAYSHSIVSLWSVAMTTRLVCVEVTFENLCILWFSGLVGFWQHVWCRTSTGGDAYLGVALVPGACCHSPCHGVGALPGMLLLCVCSGWGSVLMYEIDGNLYWYAYT